MTEFSAKYYDGETSDATDVVVRLDEHGTLHVVGLPVPVAHPLSSVRIAARLGNSQRSLTFPDGAQCETAEHAALDELLRLVGRDRSDSGENRQRPTYKLLIQLHKNSMAVLSV